MFDRHHRGNEQGRRDGQRKCDCNAMRTKEAKEVFPEEHAWSYKSLPRNQGGSFVSEVSGVEGQLSVVRAPSCIF